MSMVYPKSDIEEMGVKFPPPTTNLKNMFKERAPERAFRVGCAKDVIVGIISLTREWADREAVKPMTGGKDPTI